MGVLCHYPRKAAIAPEFLVLPFDHSKNRTVKGINLLNCVYHAQGVTLPVAYELIGKTRRLPRCKNGPLEAKERAFQE